LEIKQFFKKITYLPLFKQNLNPQNSVMATILAACPVLSIVPLPIMRMPWLFFAP